MRRSLVALVALAACGYPELPPINGGGECPTNCGQMGLDDCCESPLMTGGTFHRSYDTAADGMFADMTFPANISDFRLDKFEVTVGRFRQFVDAGKGTRATAPAVNDGAHPMIANSGWSAAFTNNLPGDTATLIASLHCDPQNETWTDEPGPNEALPINCISWFTAFAFCIFDGGWLPTEAEWNFAAAGGAQQRAYPWSNPAGLLDIDCSFANYRIDIPPGMFCTDGPNRVGSESPKGDGTFGHADLAGNVWEWVLDGFADPYADVNCNDCANLTDTVSRGFRGGGFGFLSNNLRAGARNFVIPTQRQNHIGVRCARVR